MRKARTRPLTLDVLTEIHLSVLFPSKEDKARKSSFLKFHPPRASASHVASQTGVLRASSRVTWPYERLRGRLHFLHPTACLAIFYLIGAVVSIEVVESLLHEPDKDKDNQTQNVN